VRVRDEYRNQIKAYKNLYESSINHAMRRVIDSDERKTKMVRRWSIAEQLNRQIREGVPLTGTKRAGVGSKHKEYQIAIKQEIEIVGRET